MCLRWCDGELSKSAINPPAWQRIDGTIGVSWLLVTAGGRRVLIYVALSKHDWLGELAEVI